MKKLQFIFTVALTFILFGCDNSKYKGYKMADNGLYYKYYNQNESGAKAKIGEGIGIRYILKKQSTDSLIFDSKSSSKDGSGIYNLGLSKSLCVGGIEDALLMLGKGDSASFIFSADSFFLKTNKGTQLPPFIKPGEQLIFDVKMISIKSAKELEDNQKMQMAEQKKLMEEMQVKEKPLLDKYLADNKITVKPTSTGLYFIEIKKGVGAKPKAGDEVVVNYTGLFLDGKMFDTSDELTAKKGDIYNEQRPYEPFKFILGQGQVIKGWDEAICLLSKGGKAKIILPSAIAYGANGAGPIAPFTPLTFEVELIGFGPAPAQPAQSEQPQ